MKLHTLVSGLSSLQRDRSAPHRPLLYTPLTVQFFQEGSQPTSQSQVLQTVQLFSWSTVSYTFFRSIKAAIIPLFLIAICTCPTSIKVKIWSLYPPLFLKSLALQQPIFILLLLGPVFPVQSYTLPCRAQTPNLRIYIYIYIWSTKLT